MRIAITSQNFKTVTGHAGKARRFLVFEAEAGTEPRQVERLDLPPEMAFHDLGDAPHPVDGVDVLITGGAGAGFASRLERRGVRLVVTGESDPLQAVKDLLTGQVKPPLPEEPDRCEHGTGHSHVIHRHGPS